MCSYLFILIYLGHLVYLSYLSYLAFFLISFLNHYTNSPIYMTVFGTTNWECIFHIGLRMSLLPLISYLSYLKILKLLKFMMQHIKGETV